MAETNQQKSQENLNTPTASPKDKRLRNLKPPWKKGESGNYDGKKKGVRNFSTLFDEAIKKIVSEKRLNITNPEVDLVTKAIVEALKGNYLYYRDIMDRKYGQPTKSLDITTGGESLFKWQEK